MNLLRKVRTLVAAVAIPSAVVLANTGIVGGGNWPALVAAATGWPAFPSDHPVRGLRHSRNCLRNPLQKSRRV
jgi:hypothetical protein